MSNESCPPDPIGVGGAQIDLNAPLPDVATGNFVQLHNLQIVQPLCQYGLSPALVPAVVMRLLASHFANPTLIMNENLRQYLWSTDVTQSKIRIALNTRFDPKIAGLLPALIVKRLEIESERRVIGDRLESTDPTDDLRGVSSYVRFHQGGIRIFVIAEADGEAEDLALEVFDTLSFLGPALVERLPFYDFQVVKLGELGVMDGLGNKIGIPVDIRVAYEYAWALRPLAPLFKKLNLGVT